VTQRRFELRALSQHGHKAAYTVAITTDWTRTIMPRALSHIALIVSHPTRTAHLLAGVFDDARIVREEDPDDAHPEVIVALAGLEFALIRGNGPTSRNGDHIAFAVTKEEQLACARRLDELALDYQMARGDSALYFSDYDNHVFELEVVEEGDAARVG
jgi:hypothetical protein